jgi:hypothetical protein
MKPELLNTKPISRKAKVSQKKNKIRMTKRLKRLLGHAKNLDFSGSGYNAKGAPDHSKITSNKKRR